MELFNFCVFFIRVFFYFCIFFSTWYPIFQIFLWSNSDGSGWTRLLCFPFRQSNFIKLFDGGLWYEFIRTFFLYKERVLLLFMMLTLVGFWLKGFYTTRINLADIGFWTNLKFFFNISCSTHFIWWVIHFLWSFIKVFEFLYLPY